MRESVRRKSVKHRWPRSLGASHSCTLTIPFSSLRVKEDNLRNTTANHQRDRVVSAVVGDLHGPSIYIPNIAPTSTLRATSTHCISGAFGVLVVCCGTYFANLDKVAAK
jgi:hypothetical protein